VILLADTPPVFTAGVDFKTVDFAAAAPFTYDHSTGGGAYNDGTVGDFKDVTEQLEGGQFACGDIVTYLTAIELETIVVDASQSIELDFRFLADSTGQSGAALSDIVSVSINYGLVENGDNGTGVNPGAGQFGTDSGISDDAGSTATLVSESLTGPLFTPGSELLGTVRIDDLEAGEKIILRLNVRLACNPGTRPTGNLQAQLAAGRVISPVSDTINTGQQTIPFLRIGDLAGAGEPVLQIRKTVTTASGTCGFDDVEQLTVSTGDTVKYCYFVTNPGTFDLFDVEVIDDNGTPGNPGDDFNVTLSGLSDLDGHADLGDLPSGGTASGEALVVVNTAGTLNSTATGRGNNGLSGGQFVELIDSDPATIFAQGPLIEAEKIDALLTDADGNGAPSPGDTLEYTVILSNIGSATAQNVSYTDNVDPNTTLICSPLPTVSQGLITSCSPTSFGVDVGDISPSGSVTIAFRVVIHSPLPTTVTQIVNQASISGDNFLLLSTDDPDTSTGGDPTVTPIAAAEPPPPPPPPPPPIGGDPPIYGNIAAFPTPEAALGRDLNGDGDSADTVLRYKNLSTGQVFNTQIPVSGEPRAMDLYEHTVVFVAPPSPSLLRFTGTFNLLNSFGTFGVIGAYNLRSGEVQMTNVWGLRPSIYENIISISGSTIRYYDLTTSRLTDTGIPGQAQSLWGHRIAYHHSDSQDSPPLIYIYDIETGSRFNTEAVGHFPALYENTVAFTTKEQWVSKDLNGDGDQEDEIIRFYDLRTRSVFNTGEVGESPAIYGRYIAFSSGRHIRYYDLDMGRAFDTGKLGAEPDIYQDTITYYVWEEWRGADLSADGDRLDPIVETHKISETDSALPSKAVPSQADAQPPRSAVPVIARVFDARKAHAILFTVQGAGIESMGIEIYDLAGRLQYVGGFVSGKTLTWNMATSGGHWVAQGVYLYVVTARGADRKTVRSRIQKLVVLR